MRINRSYRGKVNQHQALVKLVGKSKKYGKYGARYKVGGKALSSLAKKSSNPLRVLKPVSFADIFLNPTPTSDGQTKPEREKAMVTPLVIKELGMYCEKHNNYNHFMNQSYYIQN